MSAASSAPFGLAEGVGGPAFQPARLGPGQPDRHDRLRLAGPFRVGHRLIEVCPGGGLAPAGQQGTRPGARAQPGDGRRSGPVQDVLAQGQCLVPAPGLLQHPGALAAQEGAVGGDVVVVAVGDAVGIQRVRLGEPLLRAERRVVVAVGPARLGLQAPVQGDLQGAIKQPGPLPAENGGGDPLGVQRVADHRGRARLLRDGLRPPGDLDRLLVAAEHHQPGGEFRVSLGQLDSRSQRFQQRHRGRGGGPGLFAAAQVPQRAGQAAGGIAFAPPVAGRAPQLQRVLAGAGRLLGPVEQRQLGGQLVVQARDRDGIRPGCEPERPIELRDRLPVRCQPGRPARRRGRVPQHRRHIVRFLGVESHLRFVPRPGRAQ